VAEDIESKTERRCSNMAIKNLIKNNPWFIGLILWILGLVGVIVEYYEFTPDYLDGVWAIFLIFGWIGLVIGVYIDARIRKIKGAGLWTFFTLITTGIFGLLLYLLFGRATEETRNIILTAIGLIILAIVGIGLFIQGITGGNTGMIVIGGLIDFFLVLSILGWIIGRKKDKRRQ